MSTPYGPATGLINYVRKLPDEALNAVGKVGDFVQHPIDTVQHMMHPQQDTSWMAPAQDVQKANDSFKPLHQMTKPLGK